MNNDMKSHETNGNGCDAVQEIQRLEPWFHNLHLPDGTQTRPDHPFGDFPAFKWKQLELELPSDLSGWTALDIGCNAGFYSFELARRGARVTGIDVNPHFLKQARWAAKEMGFEDRVQFQQRQVYQLVHEQQRYDLVLFMGVFYHLRYPALGLDIVAQKVKRLMVFQTMTLPGEDIYEATYGHSINDRDKMNLPGWPKLAFLEHGLNADCTNWWVPNLAAVHALLRSSGLKIISNPGHEIHICEPDPLHPSPMTTWNHAEYLAATGQPRSAT
jgi:tRNA (mo5U34)-methyltransferase